MENQVWHYKLVGHEPQGPVTAGELQRLVSEGRILHDSLVWTEGLESWLPAAEVQGLRFPARLIPLADRQSRAESRAGRQGPATPQSGKDAPLTVRSLLIGLLMVGVFAFLSKSCVGDYLTGEHSGRIHRLEQLVNEGATVPGRLEQEYTRIRLKGVKIYSVTYHYDVDGRTYSGTAFLQEPPTSLKTTVHYLRADPGLSSLDPSRELSAADSTFGNVIDIGFGLIWAFLALLLAAGLVIGARDRWLARRSPSRP